MTNMDTVFSQIAAQHGVTTEEVREEIQAAIKAAASDPDPAIQTQWEALSIDGELPAPEDVILYLAHKVQTLMQQ